MKLGIVTINDNDNYGNRLQNYATQEILKSINIEPKTLINSSSLNEKKFYVLRKLKNLGKNDTYNLNEERKKRFKEFNGFIDYYKKKITAFSRDDKFDFYLTGSDQVWNPNFGRLRDVDLLSFVNPNKRISFSASFGVNEISEKCQKKVNKQISKFKAISVREDSAKDIIERITTRNDIEVLIDPTMLLTAEEWDKVFKKPKQLTNDKYILNYFLGNLSEERKKEIYQVARENGCEVINLLDKNSPFYETGPSEFLYLEKHAFLICTDSFHSSVFAIIYNRPFIVFDREDKEEKMNSRIETLLKKFKLKNRKYTGKITKENLQHDYTEAYKILEKERQKSIEFLEKALDLK